MKINLLFLLILLASSSALAQINENGLLPDNFKMLPKSSECEAWKIGTFDCPDTLAGKVQIELVLENEPLVTVKSSSLSELNFSFGRRVVGGNDRIQSADYCAYFFDPSFQNLTIRYFCSDLNERSWMNNTYSSLSYSQQQQSYNLICKEAQRGGGYGNSKTCWKLKNCR